MKIRKGIDQLRILTLPDGHFSPCAALNTKVQNCSEKCDTYLILILTSIGTYIASIIPIVGRDAAWMQFKSLALVQPNGTCALLSTKGLGGGVLNEGLGMQLTGKVRG